MDEAACRKGRLKRLLDLAQVYKRCSRKDLAKSLRRDPTKLIPGSGIPKLDLVVDLARVLDWPVEVVVGYLWHDGETPTAGGVPDPNPGFEALDLNAKNAHRAGEWLDLVRVAREMYEVAQTAEERSRACNREAGGWDGQGRYSNLLEAVQRGLKERPISPEFRRMLQSNLANAYYTLWTLTEAESIAKGLIDWFASNPAESVRDRKTQAFSHYVRGHTLRRLMGQEPDEATARAFQARADLERSAELYERLATDLDDTSFAGIAHTCRGGLVEIEVELGQQDVLEALDTMVNGLDAVIDTEQGPVGDWLESYGWWCIFGCNLALRHLEDSHQLQHYMAIFTNKADEIADQLDNWSMGERAFTMQYTRWRRAVEASGFEIPNVVDRDDVRLIAGTMGRFPTFRETGWQILRSAQVIRSN